MEAGSSPLTLGKIPSNPSYSVKLCLLHSRRAVHGGAVLVWAQAGYQQVPTLGWNTSAKASFTAVTPSRPTGHRSWITVSDLSQLFWTSHACPPFLGERAVSPAQKHACLPGLSPASPGHPWGTVLSAQARVPSAGAAVMPHPYVHSDNVKLRPTEKELT